MQSEQSDRNLYYTNFSIVCTFRVFGLLSVCRMFREHEWKCTSEGCFHIITIIWKSLSSDRPSRCDHDRWETLKFYLNDRSYDIKPSRSNSSSSSALLECLIIRQSQLCTCIYARGMWSPPRACSASYFWAGLSSSSHANSNSVSWEWCWMLASWVCVPIQPYFLRRICWAIGSHLALRQN